MSKTTILVETATRKLLKQVGRKDQTYDTLIKESIFKSKMKTPDPSDEELERACRLTKSQTNSDEYEPK